MSHETNRRRYILPYLTQGNYNTLMKLVSPELSNPAAFRLHVLKHYYKYGIGSAMDAFSLPRTTIYTWKRKYEVSAKSLSSLIPKSTRPHKTRKMTLSPQLVEFIRSMRVEYDHIGRAKIKYFLDEYAKEQELGSYGTTKIGLIIKRKGFNFGRIRQKHKVRPLTLRVKRSPREATPGYIEMDTVHLWVLGKKYYFITALDVVTRFAWVSLAKSPSSRQATLAYQQFTKKYKHKVRVVQTDNGSEFLGEFQIYLEKESIKHEFIYPRSPKVNGYVERFNRTFKEEFLYKYELDIQNKAFNQKLTKYLVWYNTKRPHQSLNMKAPTEFMQNFN
jgi:transposase InsO family protein